jgi:hypothetical protein
MALALAAWMRQRRAGRVELRLRRLDKILRFVQDERYRRLLLDTVRSYFRLNRIEQAEEQQLLERGPYGEVREMLQTELGRWEEQVRSATEEQVLQDALIEVLASRLSLLPMSTTDRIRQVHDIGRLKGLLRLAAVATSLEEIEPFLPALDGE